MRSCPMNGHPVAGAALVAENKLHAGRLAHDAKGGLRAPFGNPFDQAPHARAAQLFVVRNGDMNRRLELASRQLRDECQNDADKALHIARSATVQAAVCSAQPKRIARPCLAIDRHDVAMPGQDHAAPVIRPDGSPQVSLGPFVVPDDLRAHSVPGQIGRHIVEQIFVGVAGNGRKRDEVADEPDAVCGRRHQRPEAVAGLNTGTGGRPSRLRQPTMTRSPIRALSASIFVSRRGPSSRSTRATR